MSKKKSSAMSNFIMILICLAVGFAIFYLVLGNGSNFEEGDNNKHPLNIMGIMFKGGIIVPFLIAVNLIVISFTIERFITLGKVSGKGSVHTFIQNIRNLISNNQIEDAIAECDKQQGSIANVVRSG
jgi:biopolymer transport protein ExbB